MKLLKHVGKHNNKKLVVLWREIPNTADMCLVTYTESLPRQYHDVLIRTLESPQGQEAKEFNEVLHRTLLDDGRNILTVLHREGWMKKVPTNQVIITPTPQSNVRLDELNSLLRKMGEGADATRRMAELDSQAGVKDPKKVLAPIAPLMVDDISSGDIAGAYGVLTDDMLARQQIAQAKKMRADANGLILEARRLEAEAKQLKKSADNGIEKKETSLAS